MDIEMVFTRVSLVLIAATVLACSSDKITQSEPPVLFEGEITITNDAGVTIRLVEFTQRRGSEEYNGELNLTVYSGNRYTLWNELDGGDTHIFPGGDHVWLTFVAAVPTPGDPDVPLFENNVTLTVNGSAVIVVKTGGEYSIGDE